MERAAECNIDERTVETSLMVVFAGPAVAEFAGERVVLAVKRSVNEIWGAK
jgi:hypothetical protein